MVQASMSVPRYLEPHAVQWANDPKAANLAWWREARFGLFIHYGLYSALGTGEWAQFHQRIPVAEYAKLADSFTARDFDADRITDLACEAEMRYVNLVSCHHDSFALWDSQAEPLNSLHTPCGRDLVGEMAEQCARKGLGFFTYYTFMLNWRHPYFLSRDYLEMARPAYDTPQPEYRFRDLDDYPKYVEYMQASLRELFTGYGPLAGVWLDIISAYYARPDLVPIERTIGLVRQLQPHALLCYKQGATGDEDFAAPEYAFESLGNRMREQFGAEAGARADTAWARNSGKHNEICTTLQEQGWGYMKDTRHRTADEVWDLLGYTGAHDANLLVNIGPLPDGGIHPEDVATLRALGRRIRAEGWPEQDAGASAQESGAGAQ
ncbi:MAG: alpha-L-fucosidase [bacterium]